MNRIGRFLSGEVRVWVRVRVSASEGGGVSVRVSILETNSTVHLMGNIVAQYFYLIPSPIPDYDEMKMSV
jgi:hypothetical protein